MDAGPPLGRGDADGARPPRRRWGAAQYWRSAAQELRHLVPDSLQLPDAAQLGPLARAALPWDGLPHLVMLLQAARLCMNTVPPRRRRERRAGSGECQCGYVRNCNAAADYVAGRYEAALVAAATCSFRSDSSRSGGCSRAGRLSRKALAASDAPPAQRVDLWCCVCCCTVTSTWEEHAAGAPHRSCFAAWLQGS
eukprot:TRINITY_DN41137_c0_g1_i1.p1 TRINITY_DN41137_c0_g1~~TRINITY_DN41137_c0_g1_i1.p1  ORF type:complete len:195 (+),score=35.25 TRINITY_DN41137_c0_g1_i1:69-653(+)